MQPSPAPAPLRGADHSSKKHPDRRHGCSIRTMLRVRFSSACLRIMRRGGQAPREHPRAPRGLLRPGVNPARGTLRVGVNAACIGGCFRSALHGDAARSLHKRFPDISRTGGWKHPTPTRSNCCRSDRGGMAVKWAGRFRVLRYGESAVGATVALVRRPR